MFGLGTGYQARATEVFAVWQGSAKEGYISEEALTVALCNKTVKEYFEEQAHRIAGARSPNSIYAKALIEAKVAAIEWEDL